VPVDAERLEELGGTGRRLPARHPRELGREEDVVGDGEVVEQVEELEHHADPLTAVPRQRVLTEPVDPQAVHGHGAGGRLVEAGDEVEQRGLPAAGGPGDGEGLAFLDGERQRTERRIAGIVVRLGRGVQLDQSSHRGVRPSGHGRGRPGGSEVRRGPRTCASAVAPRSDTSPG
jgi:hypothetical protein